MAGERSEEDKVTQAPLEVILGGVPHEIKLLTIKEARIWRTKVKECVNDLSRYSDVTADNPEEFLTALNALLVEMPDDVIDLFFGYAKDLDREAIEDVANDLEIAKAWGQVQAVAFPLTQSLGMTGQAPQASRKVRRAPQ